MFDFFYSHEADLFTFYRVPKELMKFKGLSSDAKLLYGILLDRNSLSRSNGWFDELGRVYIIYTRQEAQNDLYISDKTATKTFKELSEHGLIHEVRQGLNKANIVYVKKFIEEPAKTTESRTRKIYESGHVNFTVQNPKNLRANNTDNNNTDNNKSVSQSVEKKTDGRTDNSNIEFNQEVELNIKNQINYNQICYKHQETTQLEVLEEVILVILDMYYSKSVTIAQDKKPQEIIRSVISKLTHVHIEYILDRIMSYNKPIQNKKGFLQTTIYNSVFEVQTHYTNFANSV